MKNICVLVFLLSTTSFTNLAQNYSATIAIGDVDVAKLKLGDDVIIPVRLVEKSGGLLSILQFFIEFDHSLLNWKGTYQEPLNGVSNFHPNMQYAPEAWAFNDNGYQLVALWNDPKFVGIDVGNKETIIEFVFTLIEKPKNGNSSVISWGDANEYLEGRLIRGVTEIVDESSVKNFNLKKINGSIKN